jgi:flagellar biosynthesis protein FlhB
MNDLDVECTRWRLLQKRVTHTKNRYLRFCCLLIFFIWNMIKKWYNFNVSDIVDKLGLKCWKGWVNHCDVINVSVNVFSKIQMINLFKAIYTCTIVLNINVFFSFDFFYEIIHADMRYCETWDCLTV